MVSLYRPSLLFLSLWGLTVLRNALGNSSHSTPPSPGVSDPIIALVLKHLRFGPSSQQSIGNELAVSERFYQFLDQQGYRRGELPDLSCMTAFPNAEYDYHNEQFDRCLEERKSKAREAYVRWKEQYKGSDDGNRATNRDSYPLDCHYSLQPYKAIILQGGQEPSGAVHRWQHRLHHLFLLRQSQCSHQWLQFPLQGGTSFEIIAAAGQLTACQLIDRLDGHYIAICSLAHPVEPWRASPSSTQPRSCLQLTAKVMYERYDGYSDLLHPSPDPSDRSWQPRRYVLSNNQSYCFDSIEITPIDAPIAPPVAAEAHSSPPQRQREIYLVSGSWRDGEAAIPSHGSHSRPGQLYEAIRKGSFPTIMVSSAFHVFREEDAAIPAILEHSPPHSIHTGAVLSPPNAGDRYRFHLQLHRLVDDSLGGAEGGGETYRLVKHIPATPGSPPVPPPSPPGNPDGSERPPETLYLFFGSSHMRYAYDAIIAYLEALRPPAGRPQEPFQGVPRKHRSLSYQNMHYIYARLNFELIAELRNVLYHPWCYRPQDRVIMLFQVGAWDLLATSLANYQYNPRYRSPGGHSGSSPEAARNSSNGRHRPAVDEKDSKENYGNFGSDRLLSMLLDILLNGDQPCEALYQVVFLTALPYPWCNNGQDTFCDPKRGYRSNAAIEANNQYYLSHLLDTVRYHDRLRAAGKPQPFQYDQFYERSVSPTALPALSGHQRRLQEETQQREDRSRVKLTVIDLYNMVRPRLGFNEDHETICSFHYICRMTHPTNDSDTHFVVTPGGVAMMEAILAVMYL